MSFEVFEKLQIVKGSDLSEAHLMAVQRQNLLLWLKLKFILV